jgi:hypothetical protein
MSVPAVLLAVLLGADPSCTPPTPPPDTMLDWLARAPVRAGLERLLERAQYGLAAFESAAWIVRDESGGVRLRTWDFSGAVQTAAWKGPAPSGALAIVHTHPRWTDARPSARDAALARRLGLPVYVLSPHGLWVALSDGRILLEAPAPRRCARLACLP